MRKYKIYCDLDGVICNFDKKVEELTGKLLKNLDEKVMWSIVARHNNFYGDLEWMPDGKELWDNILHLQPTILTGLPMGNWAKPQKISWCIRELGYETPVITTYSREKHLHSGPNCILIDDRKKLKDKWEIANGIFIHHINAKDTLNELRNLRIL